MNSQAKNAIAIVAVVTVITAFLHYNFTKSSEGLWEFLLMGYGFLLFMTMGLFFLVSSIQSKKPEQAGFGYLIGSVLKMLLAIVFLFPILFGDEPKAEMIAMNYMVPFFVLLVAEVVLVLRIIKSA